MRTKHKANIEKIDSLIHVLRGKNVMLDYDLARLYGVETKQLKRAVQRNSKRFPDDFMFQLDRQELASLRCQFGTFESLDRLLNFPAPPRKKIGFSET